MRHRIAAHFQASLAAVSEAASDDALMAVTADMGEAIATALRAGHKILLAGNGGSAGDAQHIAAELVGRYKLERRGWPAIALTTDSSALTAIGNDFGFEAVFSRQLEALGQAGDVLWAFSTSGTSANVIAALRQAGEAGLFRIGFTGRRGAGMAAHCDQCLIAPSDDTPVVQQIHMMAAHAICDAVERDLLRTVEANG